MLLFFIVWVKLKQSESVEIIFTDITARGSYTCLIIVSPLGVTPTHHYQQSMRDTHYHTFSAPVACYYLKDVPHTEFLSLWASLHNVSE